MLFYDNKDINNEVSSEMNSKELAKFLYDNEVYDSYQFIINTLKTLRTAVYCKEVILSLI